MPLDGQRLLDGFAGPRRDGPWHRLARAQATAVLEEGGSVVVTGSVSGLAGFS